MQNAVDEDAYELVNLTDWEHLMTFYGAESSLPSAHPARRYARVCVQRMLPFLLLPCVQLHHTAGSHKPPACHSGWHCTPKLSQ